MENVRAKVFVVKEQVRRTDTGTELMDFSAALMYGDIEFITRTDMPVYSGSMVQDIWNTDVARFVEGYNPETDFIIATGQPTAIFAVGYALGVKGKSPRYLVWRREENRYRVVGNPNATI